MIKYPILYEQNEQDFFHLGLGPIKTTTKATVTEERNGSFILDMTVFIDDEVFPLLLENRIIKADAGHLLKEQRFRIKRIVPNAKNKATIYAEHVSYLSAELPIKPDLGISNSNAKAALNQWKSGLIGENEFTVDSDISTANSAKWRIDKFKNPREILGGVEGSILDKWGGEYRFDNYHISLLKKRGTTSETMLSYGRNITDFEQERNITTTYTSIYPYAIYSDEKQNEHLVTIDGYVVDVETVNNFPNRNVLVVDFSSEFDSKDIPTKQKLETLAKQYIKANNVGIPKVSIKVSFLDLSKTADYQNFAPLEQVNLCDDVFVRYPKLKVSTTAKVVKTVWNVLTETYDEIEIGEKRTSLSGIINQTEKKANEANTQSNQALTSANGKSTNFYGLYGDDGLGEPKANKIGDLWYKPNGEETELYQWNGTIWEFIMSTAGITSAQEAADEAKKNAEKAKEEAEQATDSANKAVSDATHAVSVADQSKASADEAKADAANAITNANQAIKDAADSLAELEVVKDTVQDININIDEINNSLSLKVSQVDFDKLEGTVKTQATQINANAEQITLKANQSDVNTIDGKVSMVESTLTTQAGQITALNTKTDGMNTQIGSLQSSYDGLSSTISQVQTDLDGKATVEQFTNLSQTVDVIQLTVADKASQSQVTLLSDQITSVVGGLTPNLVLNGDFQTNGQGWINPNNIGTFYSVSADDKTNGAPFSAVNKVRTYASDIIASGSNWDLVSNVSTRNGSYDYLAGKQMRVSFYYSNNGAASDINAWQCYVRIRKSDGTNWYPSLYLPLAKTGWVRADFLVDLKNYKAGEIAGITVALKGFVANLNNTNLYATALMISEGGTLLDWGRDYARGASYSQITQLTDMINLRVAKEDVINQINISPESILIAGNKVQITGQTYIENGVIGTAQIKDAAITDAKIGSLSANKITTGSLNAANVNIINMNASNIVTGELTGITLRSSANGSSFYVRGNELFMQKANGDHLIMDTSGIYWYNSKGDILFQSSKKLTTSDIFGTAEYNAYLAAFNETRSVTYATALTGSGGVNDYNYLYHRARGFYGNILEVNTGANQTNIYLRPASAENEVRVTVAGGTDSYARLRAGSLMGNWLSINTATNATHLYLQAKDEVRIVNIGEGNLTNNATYMKLRASKLFANALSVNDFTSGENLYLQAKDEVRIKNVSADASSAAYKAVRASAFNTSSLAEYKTNIERFEKSALDIIGQSTIYSYNLKGDIETDEIGLVIGEGYSIAQEVVNGDGVSQYRMNSLSWKAIQELHKKIKDLENELAVLKSA
ncbi:phage tail spike protein [Enterococcus thailandicus]|uniref:phage tail spike protein n=1 Tax=Enterococcus thailandicus TaxID=417368 RepID=UPI0039A72DD7